MKIKQWLLENYELQTIKEISEYGCVSGICSGLIDTVKFHDEHEEEIWDMLAEDGDNMGVNSIPEFIASLNGAQNVGSLAQFKNLLTWYAVEREAFNIINENESDNNG